MRLLVVAPTCDGEDVGEAWLAFQWVKRLAAAYDLTVLTYYKRGSKPLSQQLPDVDVVEWKELPLVGLAERLNSLMKPSYVFFYFAARRWIRQTRRRGSRFDIAHQLGPVAIRYPSPLAGSGIPYLMGPVGGSLKNPPGFGEDHDTAPWYVGLRALDGWRLRHDPILRRTYAQASCVLGIAEYVAELLESIDMRRFEVMADIGLESVPDPVDRTGRQGPLRLLFVGRVIRTKGVREIIRAVSLIQDVPVQLDIVGDGFDSDACKSMSLDLGVSDRVNFHGHLERKDIDTFYRNADVFVFPSYREPGGIVVSEAMSYGLPLVVCDRGGPGSTTDDSCAFRLHPADPESLSKGIADAVRALADDPDLRARMGAASRRRADMLTWDRKLADAGRMYREIIGPDAVRKTTV